MRLIGSIEKLVAALFRKDGQDITLRPNQSTTYTAARDFQLPPGDADRVLVSTADFGTNVATFLATPSSSNLRAALTDETGTGFAVFSTSPALTTPDLGTPSAVTLTNGTGLPVSTGISGLGSGVATFLGTPSSANLASAVSDETGTGALVFANSPTLVTPALGTPSSATLTNATGLPISTGVAGLGSGVATFLATPSSANLAAAVSDETGSGALVFATSPSLTTPNIGVASGTSLSVNTISVTGGIAHGATPRIDVASDSSNISIVSAATSNATRTHAAFYGNTSTLAGTIGVNAGVLIHGYVSSIDWATYNSIISYTTKMSLSSAGDLSLPIADMGLLLHQEVGGAASTNALKYYEEGSTSTTFTFNGSGGSTGTLGVRHTRIGDIVTLRIPTALATSGTGSTQLVSNTAIPNWAQPLTATVFNVSVPINNNGATVAAPGMIGISSAGIITIFRDPASTAFTNATSCGIGAAYTVSYYVGTGS